jgi:hypothetical protein
MVHVNVIPLNPTGGFGGSPSGRKRVNEFCQVLEERYSVTCTPRVRRGIDINAGCGQLKSEIEKKEQALKSEASSVTVLDRDSFDASHNLDPPTPISITFDDDEEDPSLVIVENSDGAIYMDDDVDWEDHEYQTDEELSEAVRLTALVKGTTITSANAVVGRPSKATSIPSA